MGAVAAMALDASSNKQQLTTTGLVAGYALCSSLLAVINKYAVTKFGYPALLNLLRHANVDTFIVFRSLTPLLVAVADTFFRRQPWPSKLTFASLVVILAGAVGYVATDSTFTVTAYSWAAAFLVTITTEMVYIKHVVTNLGLNTWGFVLYNNLLSLMMAPFFWVVTGEYAGVLSDSGDWFDLGAFFGVSVSCVFGLLISFFGFAARRAISATAFTVTGVVNKFLTVAINVLIWDKHAGPAGLACLLTTIAGGVLYQQSVTGGGKSPSPEETGKVAEMAKGTGGGGGDVEEGGQPGEDAALLPVSKEATK